MWTEGVVAAAVVVLAVVNHQPRKILLRSNALATSSSSFLSLSSSALVRVARLCGSVKTATHAGTLMRLGPCRSTFHAEHVFHAGCFNTGYNFLILFADGFPEMALSRPHRIHPIMLLVWRNRGTMPNLMLHSR